MEGDIFSVALGPHHPSPVACSIASRLYRVTAMRHLLSRIFGSRSFNRRTSRPAPSLRFRPQLEALEDRAVRALVAPILVPGNPDCADFGDPDLNGVKRDAPFPGNMFVITDGVLVVVVTVFDVGRGEEFNFVSNLGIDAVIVKGGPRSNVYNYRPLGTEPTADGIDFGTDMLGLHAPFPPGNMNGWADISHIEFCYDREVPPPQPSFTITKIGDPLSKAGDLVNYVIRVTNTGIQALRIESLTDTLLGDLLNPRNRRVARRFGDLVLAPGESFTVLARRVVRPGDPDPLVNIASAEVSPVVTRGILSFRSGSRHTVNLFQPAIDVEKTANPTSVVVGDLITYTITVTNTSSADTPELINVRLTDSLLGNLLGPNPFVTGSNADGTLSPGETWTITAVRPYQAGDPNPLVNTAEVHANPVGFLNDITDIDSAVVVDPSSPPTPPTPGPQPPGPQPPLPLLPSKRDFLARGDVTGDGATDVIVAARRGALPVVQVFDGAKGRMAARFLPFGARFRGPVSVATADVNGDGVTDLIALGQGVRIFDGRTLPLLGVFVG